MHENFRKIVLKTDIFVKKLKEREQVNQETWKGIATEYKSWNCGLL